MKEAIEEMSDCGHGKPDDNDFAVVGHEYEALPYYKPTLFKPYVIVVLTLIGVLIGLFFVILLLSPSSLLSYVLYMEKEYLAFKISLGLVFAPFGILMVGYSVFKSI